MSDSNKLVYIVFGEILPFMGEYVENKEWIAGVFGSQDSASRYVNEATNDAMALLHEWRALDTPEKYYEYEGPRYGRVDPHFHMTNRDVLYRIEIYPVRDDRGY